jgi:serine/threonine protein kinase
MNQPTRFGKYLLLDKIGTGGMAELFLAKQTGLSGFEKVVAIKRILPHLSQGPEFVDMFINEAKLAALLSHQNIVQIYDLGSIEQAHYIAMEYIMGRDLRTVLTQGKSRKYLVSIGDILLIISKICSALDYAHRKKDLHGNDLHLVHRDISPQNILVSYEGEVKLVDFGIAKAAMGGQETKTGILKGKLAYMSPEQAWGKPVDGRTDIFALGIVLYEALTGGRLFSGNNEISILENVRKAEIVPPAQLNPEILPELETVLYKALAREPEDRYQSASEMQIALEAIITQKGYAFSSLSLSSYMQTLYRETIAQDTRRFLLVTGKESPPAPVENRSTVVRQPPRAEIQTGERTLSENRVARPPRGRGLSRFIAAFFFLIPATFLFLLLIVSNLPFMNRAREAFPFVERARVSVGRYLGEAGILPYLDGFKEGLFSYVEPAPATSAASSPPEAPPPFSIASGPSEVAASNSEPPHSTEPPPAAAATTEQPASPPDLKALYLEAKSSYNAGDLEEVEKKLRQIIEIDPGAVQAYHLLGTVYQEKKEIDAALRIFSEASALFPNDALLHYDTGFLYAQKGIASLAAQELKAALKLAPDAAGSEKAREILLKFDPVHPPAKKIAREKPEKMSPKPIKPEPVPPQFPPTTDAAPGARVKAVETLSSATISPASEQEEIRQLISKQKKGFRSKNLDLILEDHLDPPPALQKQLESWFDHFEMISVNYEIYEVKVEGNEASASILQTIVLQSRNLSANQVEKALVYWKMAKMANRWKIAKINIVERY